MRAVYHSPAPVTHRSRRRRRNAAPPGPARAPPNGAERRRLRPLGARSAGVSGRGSEGGSVQQATVGASAAIVVVRSAFATFDHLEAAPGDALFARRLAELCLSVELRQAPFQIGTAERRGRAPPEQPTGDHAAEGS